MNGEEERGRIEGRREGMKQREGERLESVCGRKKDKT